MVIAATSKEKNKVTNASVLSANQTGLAKADKWWKGGVIYQVYPRSFQDSNGDGVGDLAGITQRLPYIASLGVDAIWVSPFFTSPMKDYGYDVSDYCDVDPMFGNMADFDKLLAQAHKLGLRIMIDLVLSHTSDQHPWFAHSRTSKNNAKHDWYVWANAKPDGTPPNNWLSIFGGSAWQWDSRREQYYLHNFLVSQPDLNFHNMDVQDALLQVARFWLDRGVDGFRLDTINFYVHDQVLRDNPVLAQDQRNASIAPRVNPYNWQDHLYSKNRPENIAFLERLRALTDEYEGRACLGEVGDAQRGLQIMGQYTDGDKRMHMCYAFEFLERRRASAARVKAVFDQLDREAPNGWPCWAFSNHDVERVASRWQLPQQASKTYTILLHAMRGSVCFYQGEELGLREADVAYADLRDPYGIEFWPQFKGRDGCRTPMVWEGSANNAGFSKHQTWLPVSSEQSQQAVDIQEQDERSLLRHWRKVIAFRQAFAVLREGKQLAMQQHGDVLTFVREDDHSSLFCAFNLSDEAVDVTLPLGHWHKLDIDLGETCVAPNLEAGVGTTLAAWQCCFASRNLG